MEEYEKVIRERFGNEETELDKRFFLSEIKDLIEDLEGGLNE